jgi:multicomponent Na+:H+ antiporter subunit E
VSRLFRPWYAVLLALAFFRDLVVSSLQVARTVLVGRDAAEPRFVVVPLEHARTGAEITLVANYITLTPGTLTVDVSPDRSALLVHSLLAGDSGDGVRADVRDGIERRVLRVTRG